MGIGFPIYLYILLMRFMKRKKARWLKNEFGRLGTETINPMGKVKA